MIPCSRLRTFANEQRQGGQALVEFALVAPIFFLLLFGVIEAGRFVSYSELLNGATRDGARYAIVNGANSLTCPTGPPAPGSPACDTDGSDVRDAVRRSAIALLPAALTVTAAWCYDPTLAPYSCPDLDADGFPDGDNGRGATVTVAATYTYTSLVPIVPLPPITVRAESSLVVNN
jgi:hypothetical protein